MNPNKTYRSRLFFFLTVLLCLYSCSTLSSLGTIEGGFHTPPQLPLSVHSCTISLTDRTGMRVDNRYALFYLETFLSETGYRPAAEGNLNIEITCREQSIENDLQGNLSISAMLSVSDPQNRNIARFIYLGRSKEGLESDILLYRIIKLLLGEFMKAGG